MSKRLVTPTFVLDTTTGETWFPARYSGINMMVLAIDGISLGSFPPSRSPHIRLNDAIAWYEKELPYDRDAAEEIALSKAAGVSTQRLKT